MSVQIRPNSLEFGLFYLVSHGILLSALCSLLCALGSMLSALCSGVHALGSSLTLPFGIPFSIFTGKPSLQRSVISSRAVTTYGYVSIGILLVLLTLVWLRIVDPSWNVPILIVAFLLILSRVLLRIMANRTESYRESQQEESGSNDSAGAE